MVTVYKQGQFQIFKAIDSPKFVVWNTKKPFHEGHVDITDFKYGKYLINEVIKKHVPNKPSRNIVKKLKRLSDDKNYIDKLQYVKIKNKTI